MDNENDRLIYAALGPLGAMLLGALLIPLRGHTVASNFTFPFLALIILVAEFGGRTAALVTALTAALSLDFFLTQPYMHLAILEKNDVIAFLGMAACGLLVAVLASERGRDRAGD